MTTAYTHKPSGDAQSPLALCLHKINKRFGNVQANKDVNLDVISGTIHGIVGENGAGKSTLVSILYAFYTADSGQIEIDGNAQYFRSSADAIAAGIGMVHQHFMLVPNFTVIENIILGHETSSQLSLSKQDAKKTLNQLASQYGLEVDLDAVVQDLPVGLQQRVEILKALYRGAKILILDEPTGVLTPQETEQLFEILRALRQQGVTVLLITHKLKEIMAITDYVSVMRAGEMVAHLQTAHTSPPQLAELMVGRPVLLDVDYIASEPKEVRLQAKQVSLKANQDTTLLDQISFELRAGEILGVAGVSGNGQTELLEILSGIKPISSGELKIAHQVFTAQNPTSPIEVKSLGVAHVPEDRHAVGIILPFTAAETAILGYEHQENLKDGLFLLPAALNTHCAQLMQDFDVRPADPELKSNLFSGGNQQKLVLAREISSAPEILLVGQPTRGVDIGAIEFIHKQLLALRDKGCAILLVSVELDEILSLSDRIMVMNAGQNMGILDRDEANAQKIGLMMAGMSENQAQSEGANSAKAKG